MSEAHLHRKPHRAWRCVRRCVRFAWPLALCLALACGRGAGAARPNIVLVVLDTLRADHLGCYGYARPTSPALDALAAEALLFEDAVAPASFTEPSVATMLTGLEPPAHGVRRHPASLDDRFETVAEQLARGGGYQTGAFVSNALLSRRHGFAQGFAHFDLKARRPAELTTRAALAWIEARDRSAPFFAYVHYIDPHFPYNVPAGAARPFARPGSVGEQEYARLVQGFENGTAPLDQLWFGDLAGPEALEAGRAEYDHEVLYVDTWVGALVNELRAKGLLENTLLIVVGDHGESLRDHGLTFCHGFYAYQELLHVPLIVRPPGGVRGGGARATETVGLADLTPTMLAAAGLPIAAELPGHTLLADRPRARLLLSEGGPVYPPPGQSELLSVPGCRLTVAGNRGKCVAATTADFRLVLFPTRDGARCELYDRRRDRAEQHDVLGEHPAEADSLRRSLEAWRSSWGPEREAGTIDDETRRALGELGYH